ncbi:uncharacterized protein LOC125198256 [Salvia hispanica]|uniref:uncharacterized protein LOC125195545 n=1 Tax=Salvia hispanica TaxID=49212 RepID=UPI002009D387|nr:uncharacterized protein LOC125195545 [Salvia hispanica]XP_047952594.1 uncharacterized protein LOC125198256 [Salvia hispanica]
MFGRPRSSLPEANMSKGEELKLHITVLVNKQRTKVLCAEAGSDFMDVLLSFLLLPLGMIMKVLEAPAIGSLSTLYRGVVNLDTSHFQTEVAKQKLLAPASCYDAELHKLRLNVYNAVPASPNSVNRYDGVFTNSAASFLIGDDLKVMPNLMFSILETLKVLDIDVTDIDDAEKMDVAFGSKEIVDLLRLSLVFRNPLTAFVLSGGQIRVAPKKSNSNEQGNASLQCINEKVASTNIKKMIVKATIQKSTNKFVFAQADSDFINFLFGMLTLPLGSVLWYSASNSGLEAIDNMHRSIADDSIKVQLKSAKTRDYLTMSNHEIISHLNFDVRNHHVKGERMYMVSNNLTVSPFAMTSCISVLNDLKISTSDVEEVDVQVGLDEGLSIVKEALTSTTALEDGLIKAILKASIAASQTVNDQSLNAEFGFISL